jgi:hypothetical protein
LPLFQLERLRRRRPPACGDRLGLHLLRLSDRQFDLRPFKSTGSLVVLPGSTDPSQESASRTCGVVLASCPPNRRTDERPGGPESRCDRASVSQKRRFLRTSRVAFSQAASVDEERGRNGRGERRRAHPSFVRACRLSGGGQTGGGRNMDTMGEVGGEQERSSGRAAVREWTKGILLLAA